MRLILLLLLFPWGTAFSLSETVGGTRPATLNTPADYDPGKTYPLLVFLHGFTGSSSAYERYLELTPQLSKLGVVSIVPDGTKNSRGQQFWNATPECCDFESSGVDDVSYLTQLIQEAKNRFAIDPQRIYLMGHSNGGFMSYRMACETEGLISGIISIAGANFKTPEQCLRPYPLKVLQIHGDADDIVPYGENANFPSPQFSINYWTNYLSCQSKKEESFALDLVTGLDSSSDPRDTDRILWDHCNKGTKVGLWTIRGGNHNPAFYPATLFSSILEFMEGP